MLDHFRPRGRSTRKTDWRERGRERSVSVVGQIPFLRAPVGITYLPLGLLDVQGIQDVAEDAHVQRLHPHEVAIIQTS